MRFESTDREPTADEPLEAVVIEHGSRRVHPIRFGPRRFDHSVGLWVADQHASPELARLFDDRDLTTPSTWLGEWHAACYGIRLTGLFALESLAPVTVTVAPLGGRDLDRLLADHRRWSTPDPFDNIDPRNRAEAVTLAPFVPAGGAPAVQPGPPLAEEWWVDDERGVKVRVLQLGARRLSPGLAVAWLHIPGVPPYDTPFAVAGACVLQAARRRSRHLLALAEDAVDGWLTDIDEPTVADVPVDPRPFAERVAASWSAGPVVWRRIAGTGPSPRFRGRRTAGEQEG